MKKFKIPSINKCYKLLNDPSDIGKFRKKWLKKGFELIDITPHLTFHLGQSGECGSINEPREDIYHIQAHYRKETIANIVDGIEIIDDDLHCVFYTEKWKGDNISNFIIFRKVKI
jgi:1,2-phenylacetyl-CoA epoxidase PaaB subunit